MAKPFVEIWRLESDPTAALKCIEAFNIRQGYLSKAAGEVRIRKAQGKFTETVRGDGKHPHFHESRRISRKEFNIKWPITFKMHVLKRRYRLKYRRMILEIDVYSGRCNGLCLLRCKFRNRSASKRFQLPKWASGAEDVTDDRRYRNMNLATTGWHRH